MSTNSADDLQQMNCSHKAVSNSQVNVAENVEVPKIPVALPKLRARKDNNLQFLRPNEKPYEALVRLYIEGDKLHAIAPLKDWKQKEKNIDAKMKKNFSHYKLFVEEIFAIGGVEQFERQFPHLVDESYTFIRQELGKLRKKRKELEKKEASEQPLPLSKINRNKRARKKTVETDNAM
jgi:hypothetical protein